MQRRIHEAQLLTTLGWKLHFVTRYDLVCEHQMISTGLTELTLSLLRDTQLTQSSEEEAAIAVCVNTDSSFRSPRPRTLSYTGKREREEE